MRNLSESDVLSLPKGWVETTLGEAINLVGGGTPKTSVPSYWNGETPWLSVVDFNNDNRWVSDADKSITEEGLHNSSTKLLNKGDLIISARGTVGALAQLKRIMAFNQSCYGIKEREGISDVNFLYYLVKFSLLKIGRNVHGAVFDTITRQTFDKIDCELPPLPEQKAIAELLSSFDEKIELLREQNKTLETLAQTIFKEWFVNFNYPDAIGEMDDSELGEIPKGWRVGKLGDLIDTVIDNRGKTPPTVERGYPLVEVNSIIGTDRAIKLESVRKFVTPETYESWFRKGHPKKNDVLISTVGSIGELAILNSEKVSIAQNIVALRSSTSGLFLFQLLQLNIRRIKSLDISSVQPSIKVPHMLSMEVVIPVDALRNNFAERISPISDKIANNVVQVQTLSKTRDILLPKLMSGNIRVKTG